MPGESMQCSPLSAAGTWTELGPPLTGRIDAILPDVSDANTALIASAGGGIWQTDSGGNSWSELGSGDLADQTVVHLERSKLDPALLYALTATELYTSPDAGRSWSAVASSGGRPRHPSSSTIPDPFAFAILHPPGGGEVVLWSFPGTGIRWTADAGATASETLASPIGNVDSIAADDATGMVYASIVPDPMAPSDAPVVFRSNLPWTRDGAPLALKWEAASAGFPGYPYSVVLSWAGEADALVAAATAGSGTLVRTTADGGRTWVARETIADGSARPLVVPERGHFLVGNTVGHESLDFGTHWNAFVLPTATPPYQSPDVRSLAIQDSGSVRYVWEGTDGTFDAASYADLVRWTLAPSSPLSQPMPIPTAGPQGVRTWQTYFAVPSGAALHVGSQDNFRACTDDAGLRWTVGNGNNVCGDSIAFAVAQGDPSRAYSLTCDPGSILRSDNADAPCTDVTFRPMPNPDFAWQPSIWHWSRHLIAVDPRNSDHLAIAGVFNVTVSVDGASTATVRPLPGHARAMSVLYDSAGTLWVGSDSGVLASSDDGATFQRIDVPIPDVYALAWTATGGGEGTIYAGTRDGLYRRAPGGRFQRVLGGGGYIVSEVTVDPNCSSRVYVGFGFSFDTVHRGGIAVSSDAGTTWSSLSAGHEVHSVPVTGIQVAPTNPQRLYVSTYGRGVWSYDFTALPACR
jgi:hypothetical protein